MKKVFIFASIILLFACNNNKSKTNQNIETAAQFNPEWVGTYEGIFPCADCEGIKTTIELRPDNTYTRRLEYLGKGSLLKDDNPFSWDDTETIIILPFGDDKQLFKISDQSIVMLDSNGKEITGELAKNYILTKK